MASKLSPRQQILAKLASFNHAPSRIEKLTVSERTREVNAIGALLEQARALKIADVQKKIRSQIRLRGHYISQDGKPWMNAKNAKRDTSSAPKRAKRARKSKANATNATNATMPVDATNAPTV